MNNYVSLSMPRFATKISNTVWTINSYGLWNICNKKDYEYDKNNAKNESHMWSQKNMMLDFFLWIF